MFEDISGVEVVIDDLLIWGENREEHDERLTQVRQRARHRGLKLNKAKCQFRQHEFQISYTGQVLSKDGIKPDPKNGSNNSNDTTTEQGGSAKIFRYVNLFINQLIYP